MDINGGTQVYGIFGHPVKHTLSPLLHNAVFEKRKLNAVYLPFDVQPEFLADAFESIRALGIHGVNITLPHKESALNYVDTLPNAVDRSIGAINTVVFKNGQLQGYNTDGPAVIADLKAQLKFEPKDKAVFLIGAGGAARAVAFSLLQRGCDEIVIYNRTPERAKALSEYINQTFETPHVRSVLSVDDVKGENFDLIINASSCGMKAEDPFPMNPDILNLAPCVYDLIYAPLETKFLKEAKRRGLKTSNGLGMLIEQAVFAQMLWFGETVETEVRAAMKAAYQKKGSV